MVQMQNKETLVYNILYDNITNFDRYTFTPTTLNLYLQTLAKEIVDTLEPKPKKPEPVDEDHYDLMYFQDI